MPLLVMKFGGTSVGSAECIRRAAEIVRSAQNRYQVVVVVSAMGGVTDQIVEVLHKAKAGWADDVAVICQALRKRHAAAVTDLFRPGARETAAASVGSVMDRLADVCSGVTKVAALPPQISDIALSLGEEMSAKILAAYLEQQGIPAAFVDSGQCIITDGKFGEATPEFDATTRAARTLLMPLVNSGTVPVVTGYRGATSSGQLTTLGRGGSDYSATILGAALAADEIWIWTDVDGVLSADPRLTKNAMTLDEITFNEAVELSHYGAKVVHQRAIQPARNARIPVWIKNSFHPEVTGTRIGSNPSTGGSPVKAVTAVNRASLITVSTRQDVHPAEIFGRLLMRLAGEHVDLLFSAQSAQNSLLFALREADERHVLDVIRHLFRTEFSHAILDPVNVQRNVAVIAVLGEAMKGTPGILARLFSTVAEREVSVMAVAQGASELSICFAVPAPAANQIVQSVHDELCVSAARGPSGARSSAHRAPQKVEG
jgi:bifunctional aspartokinase / homoserine dehydrogenase 1